MIINIICDNKESWINLYLQNLKNDILEINNTFEVNLLSDIQFIKNNSDISFFLSCEKIIKKDTMLKSNNNIVVHESDLPK